MEPGLSLLATSSPERAQGAAPQATSISQGLDSRFENLFLRAVSKHSASSEPKGEGLVRLGKLTEQNPTVSHLLAQHAEYKEKC